MTPSAASTGIGTITHWIAGKPWDGPVSRWGDVYNPARGETSARVAFADASTVDSGGRRRDGGRPVLGPNVVGRAGADPLRFPRARRAP